ncbi:MAG: hypothetical protein ABS934_13565 [Psychrobacillus sp.]
MANFEFREKLKKLENAAVKNDVPPKATSMGFGCFLLGTIFFIGILVYLTISLYINKIYIGGTITLFISLIFAFIVFKLWTAPKLP